MTHVNPAKLMLERFTDEELEMIADDPVFYLQNGDKVK